MLIGSYYERFSRKYFLYPGISGDRAKKFTKESDLLLNAFLWYNVVSASVTCRQLSLLNIMTYIKYELDKIRTCIE